MSGNGSQNLPIPQLNRSGELITPSVFFWNHPEQSQTEIIAINFIRYLLSDSCTNCEDVKRYKSRYDITIKETDKKGESIFMLLKISDWLLSLRYQSFEFETINATYLGDISADG